MDDCIKNMRILFETARNSDSAAQRSACGSALNLYAASETPEEMALTERHISSLAEIVRAGYSNDHWGPISYWAERIEP